MAQGFGIGSMGLGSLMESMETLRKAWSSMSLPAGLAPATSLDELDRRITEMKAVEQWLEMNLGMLRGTIQGLEIQRGTFAALAALGRVAAEGGATAEALARAAAAFVPKAPAEATREPAGEAAAPEPSPAPAADDRAAAEAPADGDAPTPAADDAMRGFAAGLTKAATAAINPGAWWDLLQNQFGQVAQAALAARDAAAPPAPAPKPGRARAAKPSGAKKAGAGTAGAGGARKRRAG